jgi:hypothetical protein
MAIVGMSGLQSCARILLPEDERKQILRKMRNPRIEVLQRRAVLKKVIDRCKRVRNCLWCGDYNGQNLDICLCSHFINFCFKRVMPNCSVPNSVET